MDSNPPKDGSSREAGSSRVPTTHTSPPADELKKELEKCKRERAEYLAGWQRARADLLNYKKTEMERIGEFVKYADIGLILKILPILDNFELAEKNLPDNLKQDDNVKGLSRIKIQIQDFLKNQGVEEIKCLGEKFNPNFQEVVEEIEMKDKEPGVIVEEVQKGYTIHGKVLRPAKVRVAK